LQCFHPVEIRVCGKYGGNEKADCLLIKILRVDPHGAQENSDGTGTAVNDRCFSLHLIDKNLAQSQFGVNVTKNAVSLDVNPLDYGHKRNKSKST
jgi:hypothetical protein